MRSIDIHAHLMPQSLWKAVDAGQAWHGFRLETGRGLGAVVRADKRVGVQTPKLRFTPEERLKDMDEQGVDVQVVSIHTPLFSYDVDSAQGQQLAREVNDEIAAMTRQWPKRFAGLATLPVQDVGAAVAELDRAVHVLGLKGAELDTVVNSQTWDEPHFLPLFKAAPAQSLRCALLTGVDRPALAWDASTAVGKSVPRPACTFNILPAPINVASTTTA